MTTFQSELIYPGTLTWFRATGRIRREIRRYLDDMDLEYTEEPGWWGRSDFHVTTADGVESIMLREWLAEHGVS